MKKLIFGPLAVGARVALRIIDMIFNPLGHSGFEAQAFPQPHSIHQPLFLG